MIYLFDYLSIEPKSKIILYDYSLAKLNSLEYSFLGINQIDSIEDLNEENNFSIIIVADHTQKIFKIFNKIQLLKRNNYKSKISIICKFNDIKKYKVFTSFIIFFTVMRYLILSAVLFNNLILFYKKDNNQVVSNLIPDWPNTVTGEGTIYSFVGYLKKLVTNIISLNKIDLLIMEN